MALAHAWLNVEVWPPLNQMEALGTGQELADGRAEGRMSARTVMQRLYGRPTQFARSVLAGPRVMDVIGEDRFEYPRQRGPRARVTVRG